MTIQYSVVIPIKNEEDNLRELTAEVEGVMQKLHSPWELIFVDDGSDDGSPEILEDLRTAQDFLRVITFRRNFGQSSAFDAGFKAARGTYVITMDGDRQNDPADIPRLLEAMGDSDLISGWRKNRRDSLLKCWVSKIANGVRGKLCKDQTRDTGCSLKIYRREALLQVKIYHGMHRFLPALFQIEGFSTTELAVNHREREKGKSKYHFFNRLVGPILDMFAVWWMRKRQLRYEIESER